MISNNLEDNHSFIVNLAIHASQLSQIKGQVFSNILKVKGENLSKSMERYIEKFYELDDEIIKGTL